MSRLAVREVFAYYLPQYHQVPENDEWWGDGFTEWTHVQAARTVSEKQIIHYPGELGYYDLTDLTVIERQYELARQHSISSFCLWHYWFDENQLLLEKPAERLLQSDINVRFCFGWANHSWWNKTKGILLREQKYDYSVDAHFDYLLPFFKDERYTKIDGKPVFFIFKPTEAENIEQLFSVFTQRAKQTGFPGIFWVGDNLSQKQADEYGFDIYTDSSRILKHRSVSERAYDKYVKFCRKLGKSKPRTFEYGRRVLRMNSTVKPDSREMPIIFPGWDSTIRHGNKGYFLHDRSPAKFGAHLDRCCELISNRIPEDRYLIIKSWNEWAEGNMMEPCSVFSDQMLKTFSEKVSVQMT